MRLSTDQVRLFDRGDLPFSERCPIDDMDKLVRRRQYREFADRMKLIFHTIRKQNMGYFIGGDQQYFNKLFELWFRVLEKPDFQFVDGDETFFWLGGNITNILAVTAHQNGDECIKKVINQPNNLIKLLHLYTPRSRLQLPIRSFFDANPSLASMWYSSVWNWADMYVDEVVDLNIRYFMESFDSRFEVFDQNLVVGYFRCTYVDNEKDRALKAQFNRAIKHYVRNIHIDNRPNPKSVAIVSAYWEKPHAVYRSFAPFVEELGKHYDLTLVNIHRERVFPVEKGMFKHVRDVFMDENRINIESVIKNDFQIAYYTDVGMSPESIYLTNMRIAPIQAMSTGHPVSSASPAMDYFISGAEQETKDAPETNYTERLVLLPGLSAQPVRPDYDPEFPTLGELFIINCPWMHMKNNRFMAQNMRRVLDRAERRVKFHIFPGCSATRNSSFMAAIQDYSRVLPVESYSIMLDMKYPEYMSTLEQGRFALHSYPFGGGTTAADALVMGKPLVVLRGRHEYNRFSAALLARINLEELVADNADDWVEIVARLVNDPAYLEDVTARLRAADLDEILFRTGDSDNLRRCFDTLIAHDADFKAEKSRAPILIQ